MSGFHRGQWGTSDHTRHTWAGDALVSCEASRKAIVLPPTQRRFAAFEPYSGWLQNAYLSAGGGGHGPLHRRAPHNPPPAPPSSPPGRHLPPGRETGTFYAV